MGTVDLDATGLRAQANAIQNDYYGAPPLEVQLTEAREMMLPDGHVSVDAPGSPCLAPGRLHLHSVGKTVRRRRRQPGFIAVSWEMEDAAVRELELNTEARPDDPSPKVIVNRHLEVIAVQCSAYNITSLQGGLTL